MSAYGADPKRVYITGLSAGAVMASVMLAAYPEVFAAGSIVAGIPYGCAPETSAYLCMFIGVDKTPAQWGNVLRSAFPGYGGPYPRVAIWHGTADRTVVIANATELRDQWTNVWGISTAPTSTTSLPANTSVETYEAGGQTAVKVYRVANMGHGTPVDPGPGADQCGTKGTYYLATVCSAYYDVAFIGLGGTPPPTATPTLTATPTATPTPTDQPCVTATNYAQVAAGRAHHSLGQVYANGSNEAMGLYNLYQTHTLRQTGPNYYVVADGQC